jgi:hypothetical protein
VLMPKLSPPVVVCERQALYIHTPLVIECYGAWTHGGGVMGCV